MANGSFGCLPAEVWEDGFVKFLLPSSVLAFRRTCKLGLKITKKLLPGHLFICMHGKIHMFDAQTGSKLKFFKEEGASSAVRVNRISVAFDGQRLVGSCSDYISRVWNIHTGKVMVKLVGHNAPIYGTSFSRDNQMIVTASEDETARIFNSFSGEQLHLLHIPDYFIFISTRAFSCDGKLVCHCSDYTTKVWQQGALYRVFKEKAKVTASVFSSDGTSVLTAAKKEVRLWHLDTQKLILKLNHKEKVWSCDISLKCNRIVTTCADNIIRIWHSENGKILHKLLGHTQFVTSCIFSEDLRLVTSSFDRSLRTWDAITGTSLYTYESTSISPYSRYDFHFS
mmetsp:Transcript_17979/g.27061  ORF Transcript_17979/g.27061 Transcript_17979/m.27061 type:complete len:339 (+) Transcript_17979:55-1071(+)